MTFYQELCKGLNQDKLRIKTKLDDEPTKKELNIIHFLRIKTNNCVIFMQHLYKIVIFFYVNYTF